MVGRRFRTEKRLEKRVAARALEELQVPSLGFKLLLGAHTGWPDRAFFVGYNRVKLIEFKDLDGELEPKQVYMIEMLEGLGYDVTVCDNEEQAIEEIARAKMEAARLSKEGAQVSARKRRKHRAP